ncbi:subclass B1 metallo-beta-lactamase [Rubricoccus marinus]|uniref:beta-lactamase n=1 Tax=Rubricoccus marinus TaxID=716817 RepID=A0A259U2U4_9BACT|nr:subclass B1 metallo-beta-lactamase [Rubricoccus marinus]OZC04355.1 hypothetical protein BSZ36_16040 [Rubricoccus marinus]
MLRVCLLVLFLCGCQSTSEPLAPEAAPQATPATPEVARPSWEITPDLQVTEIASGVWLHVSWWTLDNGVRYPSNGLLVQDGNGLLLVDTAWGEESTAALLGWAERTLGMEVTRAFSTHWHADRLGGAPVLEARGIPFYAHPLTREAAIREGKAVPASIGDLGVGERAAFGPLEVFYPGPGHTADNTMVWVPRQGILLGGCAVKDLDTHDLGNTADADVAEWPASIARAQAAYPEARLVVPGHGPLGGLELLDHTRALLAE